MRKVKVGLTGLASYRLRLKAATLLLVLMAIVVLTSYVSTPLQERSKHLAGARGISSKSIGMDSLLYEKAWRN